MNGRRGSTERLIGVVDDDAAMRDLISRWLASAGWRAEAFACGREILDSTCAVDAVCLDLGLGDMYGTDVLRHLMGRDGDLPVIVVTGSHKLEDAIAALRGGAYDYLTKPLDGERLIQTLRNALERRDLVRTVARLHQELGALQALREVVGQSAPIQELAREVARILASDVPVYLRGESGTGKELVARAIHEGGKRAVGAFVAVNCAAIPAALQESILFGHERGAFTGALGMHQGCFEQASGGTLLLDEVAEMSLATQSSLLRTLQEWTVRRVGGIRDIPVDVRVLCATHCDLAAQVEAGRFREDLYFRLVVYPIRLPPLRERLEDLPLLVAHFFERFEQDTRGRVRRMSADALAALGAHQWPGNVRELENVIRRAILSCDGDEIQLAHLPPEIRALVLPPSRPAAGEPEAADEVVPLRQLERRAIMQALDVTAGNIVETARLLGLGRATLYRRMKALSISHGTPPAPSRPGAQAPPRR